MPDPSAGSIRRQACSTRWSRRPIYGEGLLSNDLICDRVIRLLLNRPDARDDEYRVVPAWFWGQPDCRSEFILRYDDEFRVEGLPSRPLYIPPVDERTFGRRRERRTGPGFWFIRTVPVRAEMIPGPAGPRATR